MAGFKQSLESVEPKDRKALRAWLAKNHDKSPGIWLILHKKGGDRVAIPYTEVVQELLCFGWIDSTPNKLDKLRYKLMIVPRKLRSVWSKVNKAHIVKLVAEGLMTPAGQAKIDQAKSDGSWDTLTQAENLTIPPDLEKAFSKNAKARKNFEAFSESSRKNILWYVLQAKRPETRAKRVAETVALAAEGKRANYPPDLKKT